MLEEIVMVAGNFGFPAVVSIYLLVRFEGKLEILTESIRNLTDAIKDGV